MSFEVKDLKEVTKIFCFCHCHDEERNIMITTSDLTSCIHCMRGMWSRVSFSASKATVVWNVGFE